MKWYSPDLNNFYNPASNRVNNLFVYYQNPLYKRTQDHATMPDFPFVSSLEFTNQCNLDCLFCARAVMTRPRGHMAPELFKKIISEYGPRKIFIKVNGYGENLLHPQALDYISQIKEQNGLYFTSNCTHLNDKVSSHFIDRKVDVLQVSLQGLDAKGYEQQRRGAKYNAVIENVKNLIRIRGSHSLPFIHLSTTILDEPDTQIDEFIDFGFSIGADSVGIGRTDYDRVIPELILDPKRKDEILAMRDRQTLKKVSDHSYLYRYIDVNWDGIVVSSFFDFNEFIPVGDLRKDSMSQIWNHSEVLNALRTLEKHKLLNAMKVFDTFFHAWQLGGKSYNLKNAGEDRDP